MTTKEKIKIMQSFENGKTIEFKPIAGNTWMKVDCTPKWDWANYDYRVKPESKRIPLTDEDLLERIKNGKTIWLSTGNGIYENIVRFDFEMIEGTEFSMTYETLMEAEIVFADGDPCWREVGV